MPFQAPLARSFTAASILMNAPALPGVYGVANAREWIYIAATDNIQRSLTEHVQRGAFAPSVRATGFIFEVCYAEHQQTRCDSLIREYRPICNR